MNHYRSTKNQSTHLSIVAVKGELTKIPGALGRLHYVMIIFQDDQRLYLPPFPPPPPPVESENAHIPLSLFDVGLSKDISWQSKNVYKTNF